MLSRRSVTKLILGHNTLGDEGCEELFGFLSSEAGRKYKIAEISLNSNHIGNRGLLAISRYLQDNTTLKELFLQNVSYFNPLYMHLWPQMHFPVHLALSSVSRLHHLPQVWDLGTPVFRPYSADQGLARCKRPSVHEGCSGKLEMRFGPSTCSPYDQLPRAASPMISLKLRHNESDERRPLHASRMQSHTVGDPEQACSVLDVMVSCQQGRMLSLFAPVFLSAKHLMTLC